MKYYQKLDTLIGDLYVIEENNFITQITNHKQDLKNAVLKETTNIKLAKEWLINYFNGKVTEVSFPVKQVTTPFQKKVYEATTSIPFGSTLSYKEVAEKTGSPKAFRAVGTALGKNNLLILMPCHRVINTGGGMGGFGGGIDVKIKLLKHEGALSK